MGSNCKGRFVVDCLELYFNPVLAPIMGSDTASGMELQESGSMVTQSVVGLQMDALQLLSE